MKIKITEEISAQVDGLYDWSADHYSGEWTGPRTQVTRAAVRRAVLHAVRRYGLTVERVAVRWDGSLTVR